MYGGKKALPKAFSQKVGTTQIYLLLLLLLLF